MSEYRFAEIIKEKSNEELIEILTCSHDYQPEFIELVKNELNGRNLTHENVELVQKIPEKKFSNKEKKIHGWLTLFLVGLGCGCILSLIIGYSDISISNYDTGMGHLWAQFGIVSECFLWLGYAFLVGYTIISFYNYKPNAVRLGKSCLIIIFISNLFSLIGGDYESTGFNSLLQIISRLSWQLIWFFYLSYSEQVKSLFPKNERKLFKRDKILLFTIVSPELIWLFSIFVFAFSEGYQKELYSIEDKALAVNEYTDGLIIFKCPDGLMVEKQEMDDGDIFYTLNDEEISITIYSAYDDTDTQEYFEKIMQDWSDESFNDFEYDVKEDQYEFLNGNSFYLKILQYDTEPVIKWTFSLIFNKETSKCCVISYYSMTDTDHLKELINSIRFK